MSEIIISRVGPPYPFAAYAHVVDLLPADDGGGYLITFPDLPGCMSDGEAGADRRSRQNSSGNPGDRFSLSRKPDEH